MRANLLKWGGVRIIDPRNTYIGDNVIVDKNRPWLLIIEPGVRITANCVILTHFKNGKTGKYSHDEVRICENAFIGVNSVICKSVRVGKNAIVGAGSIVTKDIPDNEVWAGNPAKFIRKRED